MNNIRQAILAAATSIEKNPDMFTFMSVDIPGCGSPGCALGWVAYHMGMTNSEYGVGFIGVVSNRIALGEENFYDRMNEFGREWKYSAPHCAKALRLYADKHHPQAIPESVLSLFKEQTHGVLQRMRANH